MSQEIKIHSLENDFTRIKDLKKSVHQYKKNDTGEIFIFPQDFLGLDSELSSLKFFGENIFNFLANGKHCSEALLAKDNKNVFYHLSKKIEHLKTTKMGDSLTDRKISGLNIIVINSLLMADRDSYNNLNNMGFVKTENEVKLYRFDFGMSLDFYGSIADFTAGRPVPLNHWKKYVGDKDILKKYAEFISTHKPVKDEINDALRSFHATPEFILAADNQKERLDHLKYLASISPDKVKSFCKPYEKLFKDLNSKYKTSFYSYMAFNPGYVSKHIIKGLSCIKELVLHEEAAISEPDTNINKINKQPTTKKDRLID